MSAPSRRLRRLALTIACVGVLGVAAAPASADSASTYLARETSLIGPCGGTYFTLQTSGLTANPDTWYGTTSYVRVDTGGSLETIVRRRSGVSKYDRYRACSGSSNWRQVDSPTKYKHQFIYQNWLCYDGGCQYLYTNYGSWIAGV